MAEAFTGARCLWGFPVKKAEAAGVHLPRRTGIFTFTGDMAGIFEGTVRPMSSGLLVGALGLSPARVLAWSGRRGGGGGGG